MLVANGTGPGAADLYFSAIAASTSEFVRAHNMTVTLSPVTTRGYGPAGLDLGPLPTRELPGPADFMFVNAQVSEW